MGHTGISTGKPRDITRQGVWRGHQTGFAHCASTVIATTAKKHEDLVIARCDMPNTGMSQKNLNTKNLAALGADKLAGLLIEVSTGSADIKRRLRLELSYHLGCAELGREVAKRLASIRKSKTYAGWRKRKSLVKDLQTQADMICDKIALDDPTLALELLWDFMAIAPFVYARVDDSRGDVQAVFTTAKTHFAKIAPMAVVDPKSLAARVWTALVDDHTGEFDGIIDALAPALGDAGLAHLKTAVIDYRDTPDTGTDHAALAFLRSLRNDNAASGTPKMRQVKAWLQDIAVAQCDPDTYVAQYTEQDLRLPDVAAEVAQIWLDSGRDTEALDLLTAADLDADDAAVAAWDAAYVTCLSSMGRSNDAQSHHWDRFTQTLGTTYLRGFIKPLPDFEDVEAEDRAKAFALTFPECHTALRFFLDWPDLALAARLIETRVRDIDGGKSWQLKPAIETLRTRHPLAAVLLLRAMIADALVRARFDNVLEHLADCIADCAILDADISDYGLFPPHAAYIAHLMRHHSEKTVLWYRVT